MSDDTKFVPSTVVLDSDRPAWRTPDFNPYSKSGSMVKDNDKRLGTFKAFGTYVKKNVEDYLKKLESTQGLQDELLGGSGLSGVGGIAATFIGKNANTFSREMEELARNMRDSGATPRDIWNATESRIWNSGTRQEIPDNKASIYQAYRDSPVSNMKLGEVLDHGPLYESYPSSKNIKVILDDKLKSGEASYKSGGTFSLDQIRVNPNDIKNGRIDTLLHEVQHAIQIREGWQNGHNPTDILKELRKQSPNLPEEELRRTAYELYRKIPGEVEARNNQRRMAMTAKERGQTIPDDTTDISIQQMVRSHLKQYGVSK